MQELVFGLFGGTALLMFGVDKMGKGLENASGDMMKKILTVLTGRIWSAFLVGTFLTALVQSSTAITLLTVGFVNAGLMQLPQAVGIIVGANIGTTITAQLMSFSFHFKLTDYALPVIAIGFAIETFARRKSLKEVGSSVMGFGLMFLGLKTLNAGVPIINANPTLRYFFLNYASIPLVGVLLGMTVTALVHSSAATVGLSIVLGRAGLLDLPAALTIILGDNIGTTLTAQMASLTGTINARRTAWAHTLYNTFGVILVMLAFPWFVRLVVLVTGLINPTGDIGAQIANSHTLFNSCNAILFLPMTRYYIRFLEWVIRGKAAPHTVARLDRLLLESPVAAFRASLAEIIRGTEIAKGMVDRVMKAFRENTPEPLSALESAESTVNQLQKDITLYIVDISKRPLSDRESVMVPAMINSINNVERIGDHAMEMRELVQHKVSNHLAFSPEAMAEIDTLDKLVGEMFSGVLRAMHDNNIELARKTARLEDKVDAYCQHLNGSHLRRLEEGRCQVDAGVIFLDMVNHYERIADHLYKICLAATDELHGTARFTAGVGIAAAGHTD